MDLFDRILHATHIGESTDWEFKSAKGGFPGSFWETYSAMANSEGGWVILGVREKDQKAELDGLSAEQVERYKKALWDGLNDRGKVNINLLQSHHVQDVAMGDVRLLVIEVPRATRMQRPVYLGGNPLGGNPYRRRHEGDYHCSDAEVRRMFSDADEMSRDYRILKGFHLSDLDEPTLAQYRQLLKASKVDHPWATLPDKELLEKLGGWRRDKNSGEEGLTLAGLLMFGKDQAIRDPDATPAYFVDYREKLNPEIRWTDRIVPDGTWEANLFQFFHRVIPKLYAGLPTPFQLVGSLRRDYTPAHEALREAFVNSLIHGDYTGAGGVVVERYPDRFLFHNPGVLLISQEQYRQGGVSECRNRALQRMFSMIGGGEKAGSGVDKIHLGWSSNHWRAPKLTLTDSPDRVWLELPMVSLIPDSALAFLKARFGAGLDTLSVPERHALATAHLESAVSNIRLQEILADHKADITCMLQGLCERGFLARNGRGRWTTYLIPDPQSSRNDLLDSLHSAGDSLHSAGDSLHSDAPKTLTKEMTPLEWSALEKRAEPIAGKSRVSTSVMEAALLEICMERYLTLEQLGRLVNRDPENLRHRYLKPLIMQGRIRLRFPNQLNRPDQAYTTVDKK